jgi:Leucine-rich repeat (LRR) protein
MKLFQEESLNKKQDVKLIAFNDFKNRSIIKTSIENLLSLDYLKINNAQIFDIKSVPTIQLVFNGAKFLDLSSNQIEDIQEFVHEKYNLKKLHLSNNKIEKIPNSVFVSNKNLQLLDLSRNKLATIDSKTFSDLANLKMLNLAYNELVKIPQFNLPNLKILDMGHNQLSTLNQASFLHLTQLQKLKLDHNFINDFGLADCPFLYCNLLKILSLRNNKIKLIENCENAFTNLSQLRVLDLAFNFIEKLDSNFYPSQLEKLRLNYNSIGYLEQSFFLNMSELKVLNLTRNHLKSFQSIEINTFLEVLNLSQNRIEHFSLSNFKNWNNRLKFLNLSNNFIRKLDRDLISNLNHYANLVLNNNLITEFKFPGMSGDFSNLNIENNNLKKFDLKCPILKKLDICNNPKIIMDSSFYNNVISNSSLVELYLDDTNFQLTGRLFSNLYNLKMLNLSNNLKIKELSIELFFGLDNLEFFYIHSCSIQILNHSCFAYLKKLIYLDLSSNELHSELSKEVFYGMERLSGLNLSKNKQGLKLSSDFYSYIPNLLQLIVSKAENFSANERPSFFIKLG